MAEVKAGQQDAQQEEQQQEGEQQQDAGGGEGGEQKEQKQADRTYSQAELDRILGKVRKNARYLGRKEAEAELVARGATRQQAEQTVDRQQQEQKAPVAPKREDFEHYEDYLDARADFKARSASREEQQRVDQERRQQRVADEKKSVEREFKKRADVVMKEIPDWAETIESAENVMISEAMGEAIQESELGPRILYRLVQNPDEADRISQLAPKAQLREIGKLEARIEAELQAELKGKAKPQGEEGNEDEEGQQGEEQSDAGAEGKGEGKERAHNADGTFKSAKKRAAPEPIEPGSARSATGSRLPSDKDDIETWNKKMDELERREGRR